MFDGIKANSTNFNWELRDNNEIISSVAIYLSIAFVKMANILFGFSVRRLCDKGVNLSDLQK